MKQCHSLQRLTKPHTSLYMAGVLQPIRMTLRLQRTTQEVAKVWKVLRLLPRV